MIKPSTLTGEKRSIWPIDRPRENPTIGKVKNSRNNPRGSPPICKEGGFSMTKNQFSSSSVKMSSFATANPTDVRCGYILARPLWRRFTSSVDIMIIYDSVLDSSLLSLAPQKSPSLTVLQISNNQWDDRHCFNKATQRRTAFLSPVQNANLSMHVTLCRCPLLGFCTCDLYAIV